MDGIAQETIVRMSVSQTAKGLIQLDVSATAPTVEKCQGLLGQAIDAVIQEVKQRGMALAHQA
jgi:hypothetical protein